MLSRLLISILFLLFYHFGSAQQFSLDNPEVEVIVPNEKAYKFLLKAEKYYQNQDFEKAIEFSNKALEEDIGYVDAYNLAGLSIFELGNLNLAYIFFENAIKYDPENYFAHLNLGKILDRTGEFSRAVQQYERAIEIDRSNPSGHFQLTNTLFQLEEFPRSLSSAKETYECYIKKQIQNKGDVHALLAVAYLYNDSIKLSKEHMMKAKEYNYRVDPELVMAVHLATVDQQYTDQSKAYHQSKLKKDDRPPHEVGLSEVNFLYWAKWYLETPLDNEDPEVVKGIQVFLLHECARMPNNLIIGMNFEPFMRSNSCMIAYMLGWKLYSDQTGDADEFNLTKAALITTIEFYEFNKEKIGKIKSAEKVVEIYRNGDIDEHIRTLLH